MDTKVIPFLSVELGKAFELSSPILKARPLSRF